VYALIERAAARAPGTTAVVGDHGHLTYGELLLAARRVATGLRATGRSRLAVVEPDAARTVVLLAAGCLTGVELCFYPPVADPGEVADLATRLDHDLLISDRTDLGRPTVRYDELDGEPVGEATPPARQPVLVLTTGTTGVPRGVRHDWSRLVARAAGAEPAPDQRWLLAFGVHQFAGYQIMIHVASIGATLVDPGLRRPRPGLAAMRAHGVTHASATPTFWRFLLAELRSDGGPAPALTQVTLGGEAVPAAVLTDLRAAFPGARVSQIYAASEFGATGAVNDGRNGLPRSVLERGDEAEVAMKVVDGELWVRSRLGMLGYHGEDAVDDPDGWRPTGDLVEVVADRVLFRGRAAEIINVGGVKVHPLPVEERISTVPGVAVVRVHGRRNALTGAIVAVEIVPAEGADPEAVRAGVADACADLPVASRPRSVRFVDAVPTLGQKILRRSGG
jgi:acyl-CoA synthetase (AMP-forming)/AMP-acid ligase II